MTTPVVLAYSGDADAGGMIRELATTFPEVVTLTLDLGQGRDFEEIRERALASGAARAHVLDVREEFVRDFVLPTLQARVPQFGSAPLAAALGQAVLALKLTQIAAIENARSVAHGAVDDNKRRLAANIAGLDSSIAVTVLPSREQDSPDRFGSLWGHYRTGTGAAAKTIDTPAAIDVSFERGVPVAINGIPMSPVELIESLSTIGERHGIGRAGDGGRLAESSGVPGIEFEAPAAIILYEALRTLDTTMLAPDLIRTQLEQAMTYAELVYDGQWFSEERAQFDDFNAKVQQMITGTVRVKLFGGSVLSSSMVEGGAAAVRS